VERASVEGVWLIYGAVYLDLSVLCHLVGNSQADAIVDQNSYNHTFISAAERFELVQFYFTKA